MAAIHPTTTNNSKDNGVCFTSFLTELKFVGHGLEEGHDEVQLESAGRIQVSLPNSTKHDWRKILGSFRS